MKSALRFVATLAFVTSGWWVLCGLDSGYSADAEGYQQGPLDTWQVVAFVLVSFAAFVIAGLGPLPIGTAVAVAIVTTVNWSVWASGTGPEPNLWPVGAGMVLMGGVTGGVIVAGLTHRLRSSALEALPSKA